MRARFSESAGFTLALLVFLGIILYLTVSLNPVARMVPLVVLVPTILLVSLEVLLELVPGLAKRYRLFEQKDVFGIERLRESVHTKGITLSGADCEAQVKRDRVIPFAGRESSVFAWIASIPVLIYILGFLMAVPLFLFLYLRWRSEESWTFSITTAAASLALLYLLFIELLRAPLYEGRLWMWLL
ncbi:MAG: hypothetical protein L0229_12735 [Blastocatellia bacterium]|nr:hypothetical protein [Blastocatellia bacterium]